MNYLELKKYVINKVDKDFNQGNLWKYNFIGNKIDFNDLIVYLTKQKVKLFMKENLLLEISDLTSEKIKDMQTYVKMRLINLFFEMYIRNFDKYLVQYVDKELDQSEKNSIGMVISGTINNMITTEDCIKTLKNHNISESIINRLDNKTKAQLEKKIVEYFSLKIDNYVEEAFK